MEKHSVSRLSYLFSHLHLLSSYSFSSTLLSSNLSLLSASSLLCFSSVHIVGSLTSKLPSIMCYMCCLLCIMMYVILTHTRAYMYINHINHIRYDVLNHMMCILYDVLCIMCYLLIMCCVSCSMHYLLCIVLAHCIFPINLFPIYNNIESYIKLNQTSTLSL